MPQNASSSLITCDHVTVTLAGRTVLHDIDFRLERGQSWLVLGRNGSGKSTLLRLLRGDIWPDDNGGQRRYFSDQEAGRASPLGLRHRLGLVSLERARALKRLGEHLTTATCILAGARDTLYLQGTPSTAESRLLADILEQLGLAPLADRPVAALSNGQLRAVLLARALMRQPLALFLDEFLDGLDRQATQEAGRAVQAAAQFDTALVITSHLPQSLPVAVANGLLLHDGRIIASGPASDVLTRYQATSKTSRPETGASAAMTQATPPEATPHDMDPNLPLVVLENASVILDERPVLDAVSLTIRPGEHLALLGANGSGKTTLLRLMAGLYHPALGGRVSRPGLIAPEGLTDLRDIRKRIGMVSFELEAEYEKELTGLELVLSGLSASIGLYADPTPAEVAAARRWLDFFDVAELAQRPLGRLSAGQTRRLFLARAMVAKPRLLLLDEPFAALDAESRQRAMASVSALARSGVTILSAVHQPGDIIPEIRTIIRLDHGRLQSIRDRS